MNEREKILSPSPNHAKTEFALTPGLNDRVSQLRISTQPDRVLANTIETRGIQTQQEIDKVLQAKLDIYTRPTKITGKGVSRDLDIFKGDFVEILTTDGTKVIATNVYGERIWPKMLAWGFTNKDKFSPFNSPGELVAVILAKKLAPYLLPTSEELAKMNDQQIDNVLNTRVKPAVEKIERMIAGSFAKAKGVKPEGDVLQWFRDTYVYTDQNTLRDVMGSDIGDIVETQINLFEQDQIHEIIKLNQDEIQQMIRQGAKQETQFAAKIDELLKHFNLHLGNEAQRTDGETRRYMLGLLSRIVGGDRDWFVRNVVKIIAMEPQHEAYINSLPPDEQAQARLFLQRYPLLRDYLTNQNQFKTLLTDEELTDVTAQSLYRILSRPDMTNEFGGPILSAQGKLNLNPKHVTFISESLPFLVALFNPEIKSATPPKPPSPLTLSPR